MLQYWWIPIAVIMYSTYAYLTKQNNLHQTPLWFWIMWAVGAIPLWNWVSLRSKQLLVDGFMYDLVILLSYVCTLIYLGEADKFASSQWVGLGLGIIGIVLMKVKLF